MRISRGQSAPWTSVFNKIHIEFGNETWNGSFRGESMNYNAYPQLANKIFGAARQTTGYTASKFDLVLDGMAASPGYNGVLLATSTQHDSIDIAPYLLYSANNEAQSTMFGALLAEPEVFNSAGGEVYQNMVTAKAAPTSTYVNVYETNLGTMTGGITESAVECSWRHLIGGGLAHTDHMLQMMRNGVQYQNAFSLPQFNYRRSDGSLVRLWGTVVDMGTTNRRRPQFLTQALANSVIGGNMLLTVQTGSNPTWNQPMSQRQCGVEWRPLYSIVRLPDWEYGCNDCVQFEPDGGASCHLLWCECSDWNGRDEPDHLCEHHRQQRVRG